MEITKSNLLEIIEEISSKIDNMNMKLQKQEQFIQELKEKNEILKQNNQATLEQITEYIQELEQIRNHYVDSNDKNRG